MNQKQEKKFRRERRKMIQDIIERDHDLVLREVMKTMISAKLSDRIKISFQILTRKIF